MRKTIGRYEIIEELGQGGMATVYLASDTRLDRQVALKLMNQALRDDPAFVARFEREAKTVAALEHGAIVPIYDYGEADNWLFLVMRYMQGGSLRERIAGGALPLNQAYDVVHRIGAALDEAHNMGIVHRDLKPNNILLDQAGRAFLSDFGVLKLARGDTTYLTRTGETVGTYAYMSPEQIRGEELDGRSDIYALGTVLYEMLTGAHPFGEVATTSGAMAIAHAHEPVPEIAVEAPHIPRAVNDVIAKAMAKSPSDRFETGKEMAEAMLRAMTARAAGPGPVKPVPAGEAAPDTPTPSATAEAQTPAGRQTLPPASADKPPSTPLGPERWIPPTSVPAREDAAPAEASEESMSWWEVWTSALFRPSLKSYERILNDPKASPNRAYSWVFISALITYLISSLLGLALSALGIAGEADQAFIVGTSVITLLCLPPIAGVLAVVSLMIWAAITQFTAGILGGTGTYSRLVYVFGAYSAPLSLISGVIGSIPFVGPCLAIPLLVYGFVLNVISVNVVNKFGWGKSIVAAVVIPITLLVIITCVTVISLTLLGPAIGDVFSQIVDELSTPLP